MTKISYSEARKRLIDACEHYLTHNQSQLDELRAVAPVVSDNFLQHALNNKEPGLGFRDWVACEFYAMLQHLLSYYKNPLRDVQSYMQMASEEEENLELPFKKLKFLKGFNETDNVDLLDPKIVLHNLQALSGLFAALHLLLRMLVLKKRIRKEINCFL